jgi:hypothetical protein
VKNRAVVISAFMPEARLKRRIRQHLRKLGFEHGPDGALTPPSSSKESIRALGEKDDRPAGPIEAANMNGNRYYAVRVEGAKYGVSFGSALAIAISYTANHSILWAIIHGILGWLYVIYYALFRS